MWEEKDRQQQCVQEHLEEIERLKDKLLKIREETNEDITSKIKPLLKDCKDCDEHDAIDSALYISDSMFDIYDYALDALFMSIEYWKDNQKVDLTFMKTPEINFDILDRGYDFLEFEKHTELMHRKGIIHYSFGEGVPADVCEKIENILEDVLCRKFPYHIKTNWCMIDNLTTKFIKRYRSELEPKL